MLHQLIFINKLKDNRGYVALMSVLVVSGVGAIVAVSLLTLSIIHQRSSFNLEEGYRAKSLAYACINVALQKILLDASYVGGENVSFANNQCNILPISKVQDTYTVNTKGVVGSILSKNKVVVTRTEDPDTLIATLSVDSWQEVADY